MSLNGPVGDIFQFSRTCLIAAAATDAESVCASKGICMRQIQNGRKNDKYTICNLKPTAVLCRTSATREKPVTYTQYIYYTTQRAVININKRSSSTVVTIRVYAYNMYRYMCSPSAIYG